MKKKILELIEERQVIYDKWQESYDDEKSDYSIEEPGEIDGLGNKIRDILKNQSNSFEVDFIIESLTKLGDAPQVIYDDNGHFAVSGDGMSPAPMPDGGKFEETESFVSIVDPECWYDTIRKALNHYLKR